MKFIMPAVTEAILGEKRVEGVRFKDGLEVPADLVVMAVGIRPNIDLAKSAGLYCERGVVVNDTLQTYDPRIYAVGECVQHRGKTYGLVAPLFEMAKVAANHLAKLGYARYEGSVTSTKLKVTGIDLFSAGDFMGGEGTEEIVMKDAGHGVYKKLVLKDNRIVGTVLYGDTVDGAWYFQLMKDGTDVSEHTKASASCGSCTGLVEQILAATVGGDYDASPKEKPLCPCTDFTHQQVREAIRERHLTRMDEVMRALDWRSEDGCPTCRPALNYYLISTWPAEAKDDPASRFINERVHANTPEELRAIAEVAEKYQVPTVKITGGQRIDLLGVKKEDLPAMWADLNAAGFVSGHAYGKALRTVKTCVGSEWCRFGTQDSTGLGIQLEKITWGSWMPHKFKMAVSGCPRNCAEATIKDFGVVCVDSGYELHIGGNGGVKVRATDLLTKVTTPEEVIEYCCAFIQLYREEGWYLERTAPWVEDEGRRALYQRFLESQKYAQQDPWAALSQEASEKKKFIPLKQVV